MVIGIISGLLLGLAAFLSVLSQALRTYHRARLAQYCRRRSQEDRFSQILREDDVAQLTADLLFPLVLTTGTALGVLGVRGAGDISWESPAAQLLGWGAVLWFGIALLSWTLARVWGEALLYLMWPLTRLLVQLATPLRRLARLVDTLLHRLAGRDDPGSEELGTLTEEIQSVIEEGEREGVIEARSGRMIQRVMELGEEDVRAVMTPRIDIISIPVHLSVDEARQQLLEAGHSRIPVIDASPDQIVGILYARDLLEHVGKESGSIALRDILRDPFYVPETTTVDALLERMKRERLHLAIVLDEYGGVAGLVTLEDILEEIVGDIADEFDEVEDDSVRRIDPQTIEVDARIHLDELNEQFDLQLPDEEDFDTLGGFVFHQLGRIPSAGEKFTWQEFQFLVAEATDRSIVKVQISSSTPWHLPDPQPEVPTANSPSSSD